MLIYLDLDTNRLVIGPGNAGLVGGYATPRGSGPLLRVQPVQGGQLVALPDDFEMTWTVKEEDDWGGDILAYAEDFVQEAGTTVYSCAVNYETTALDTLLGIGGTEVESVALIAQLAWRADPAAVWRPTQVVDLHLHNSIWRGVPGAPEITPDSFDWLAAALVNAAGISFAVDTEAETITIGLALTAGAGLTITTDGGNKVVAQDVQYALATTDQDFLGGTSPDSGVMTDDDTLEFEAAANSVYEVTLSPRFIANYAPVSRTAHQAVWSLPAGASVVGSWIAPIVDAALDDYPLVSSYQPMSSQGDIFINKDSGTAGASTMAAIITTAGTAGTVKLRVQCFFNNTTADKITRKAGSFLIARRIS
jgi:hypothetical protein